MVVIVIIGLLATIVIINVMPAADRAAVTKARADIATLEQGDRAVPARQSALSDHRGRAAGAGRRPLHPPPAQRSLGQSLSLCSARAGTGGRSTIASLGADGREGGTGENADITN